PWEGGGEVAAGELSGVAHAALGPASRSASRGASRVPKTGSRGPMSHPAGGEGRPRAGAACLRECDGDRESALGTRVRADLGGVRGGDRVDDGEPESV